MKPTSYSENGEGRPSAAFESFAHNTGMHLIPYIVSDRHRRHRLAWGLLMIIAVGLLISQISVIIQKLYSFPTSAQMFVTYNSPMDFPAVTFCNLNPIALNKLYAHSQGRSRYKREVRKSDKNVEELLYFIRNKQLSSKTKVWLPSRGSIIAFGRKKSEKHPQTKRPPKKSKNSTSKRKTQEATDRDRLMYLINVVDEKARDSLLYHLDDLLVACSFKGLSCDQKDFVRVRNPHFGSCFTFNSGVTVTGRSRTMKQITNSGMASGLELTLFIDSENYVPDMADVAGFRILVHDPNRPAMPDRNGHMLHPGAFSTLGVRLTRFKRVPAPHGKCKHYNAKERTARNMFQDSFPLTSPGMAVCMRTCEQLAILKTCGCFSLEHGFATAHAFESVNKEARNRACDISEEKSADHNCTESVLKEIAEGKLGCKSELCRYLPCNSRRYTVSLSTGKWPSTSKRIRRQGKHSVNSFIKRQGLEHRFDLFHSMSRFIRNNFLKVLIFMEDLNVVHVETQPAYLFVDFLSELGAQAGLWLGISVVTVIEIFVMLCEVVWFYFNPIATRLLNIWTKLINTKKKQNSYEPNETFQKCTYDKMP